MKRLITIFLAIGFLFTLTACDGKTENEEADSTVTSIVTLLETAGYELTEHDSESREYFSSHTLVDLGLDMTITDLFVGYLDQGSWVEIIGCRTEAAAQELKTAFVNDGDESRLVYQEGNTVVVTYTQTTFDLFN